MDLGRPPLLSVGDVQGFGQRLLAGCDRRDWGVCRLSHVGLVPSRPDLVSAKPEVSSASFQLQLGKTTRIRFVDEAMRGDS